VVLTFEKEPGIVNCPICFGKRATRNRSAR